MNKLPYILLLGWGWNTGGHCEFVVNGKRTPHGIFFSFTIFGWGLALADLSSSNYRFVPSVDLVRWRKRRKLLLGHIVPQPSSAFPYVNPWYIVRYRILHGLGRI